MDPSLCRRKENKHPLTKQTLFSTFLFSFLYINCNLTKQIRCSLKGFKENEIYNIFQQAYFMQCFFPSRFCRSLSLVFELTLPSPPPPSICKRYSPNSCTYILNTTDPTSHASQKHKSTFMTSQCPQLGPRYYETGDYTPALNSSLQPQRSF